jgi:cupin fold WbuC family metalloprotein
MIIALARDCLFPPHRHPSKTESYHMIHGRLVLIIFDDSGTPVRSSLLTPPGQEGIVCFRLGTPAFHAILQLDDVVVFHEVTNGPFRKGEAILAPWSPTEEIPLRIFLENAAISSGMPPGLLWSKKPE